MVVVIVVIEREEELVQWQWHQQYLVTENQKKKSDLHLQKGIKIEMNK